MPSVTFQNLTSAKQANVKQALVDEFSNHTLATAQVARIIKRAGIARGTFYKYFPDLIDAYQWLLQTVMEDLHLHPGKLVQGQGTAHEYQAAIRQLMARVQQSNYGPFLKNYYEANEGFLSSRDVDHKPLIKLNSQQWAIMVLCHQTIEECLLNPADQETVINRLGTALTKIIGG